MDVKVPGAGNTTKLLRDMGDGTYAEVVYVAGGSIGGGGGTSPGGTGDASASKQDEQTGVLHQIDGHVDTLESLIGSTNTGLASIDSHVDGLEAAAADHSAKLDTLHADMGAPITAPSPAMPAGGSGLIGWISAIWQKLNGTLAVSGPMTNAEMRAAAVNVSLGAATVAVTGPATNAELRATALPVSVSSIALPTGAATETSLAGVNSGVAQLHSDNATVVSGLASIDGRGASTVSALATLHADAGATNTAIAATTTAVGVTNTALASTNSKLDTLHADVGSSNTKLDALHADNVSSLAGLGALTETPPASDTASSGLNGRLQRLAQNISAMALRLPAALGVQAANASLSIVPATGSQFAFGGTGKRSQATVTRAANTTAYSALDVVGGAFELTNIGPSGSAVLLTSVDYRYNVPNLPTGIGNFRMHLYSATPPSAIADNSPFDLATGDLGVYLGYVDIGILADLGSNLYCQADRVNKQVQLAGTSLFGYLVSNAAFTPAAASEVLVVSANAVAL